MIAPGALVIGSPLVIGLLLGCQAIFGLLAGAIISGVQLAISQSNTGAAWDNAKKEVEKTFSAFRAQAEEEGVNLDQAKVEFAELGPEPDIYQLKYINLKPWVTTENRFRQMYLSSMVGDTIGDPLKDTSGPSINILIKLAAITSLVFGEFIK